ncbi:twisted gastrulation protein homolog 1-B-like [Bacillus rossius redtenbacheri]|uniref:twisted gastrulation protein homolog 1-B-like n=1 Tax=Bacillus rossius redtenbacheri TaxID=93214 RepID=UPI002FDD6800
MQSLGRTACAVAGAVAVALLVLLCASPARACNEAVCASVVSKCMLTQSCKCDIKNCSCCKDCYACLGELYSECCSCVDICPKPNDTVTPLGRKSHVEEFTDPVPELFQALMGEPDPKSRWVPFTFPVDYDTTIFLPKTDKAVKYHTLAESGEEPGDVAATDDNTVTVNCTVAFMSQCMPWNKCKASCSSTGAAAYRWFHDGCCECVGTGCINYGISESNCLDCPERGDIALDDDSELVYDYYSDPDGGLGDEEKIGDSIQSL